MELFENGLSATEVAERVAAGRTNAVEERSSRSFRDILRANIFTRFNALLGAIFVVVVTVGSPADALFGFVIVINSAIGIIQETRAKRTLDKLAILNAPRARAMREGEIVEIAAADIVQDDLIYVQAGDQIPADGRSVHSDNLEVNESLLTGEADPIFKKVGSIVMSGSAVVAGSGYVKVTAVGAESYAHKLAARAKQFSMARSELMVGTNTLLKYIGWVVLVVAPVLVWGQIVNSGDEWQEAAVRSAAAIIGIIPEGLVLLTSLAFAVAVMTLARRNVLAQQLPAVEVLARVDVLCLDKTGTLTENRLEFEELVELEDDADGDNANGSARKAAESGVREALAGFAAGRQSPVLEAIGEWAEAGGFDADGGGAADGDFRGGVDATEVVAFSSARKWSAIGIGDDYWVMGAPEIVFAGAGAARASARAAAEEIAGRGKRVVALARAAEKPAARSLPKDLRPAALAVLAEKVRSDAAETLGYFAKQGVKLKIISGDSPRTVGAVAAAVGLVDARVADARDLPNDIAGMAAVLDEYDVFGRVTPAQKRLMVQALQSRGHVVAMTGDGVNDALAVKEADLGVAMGNGAPATKAVADLVLLDSRFDRMPGVLAEGRRVIANIERVANLFLIKNAYALLLALTVTLAGLPFPFLPRHLTVLSSLTIGIPAFFLALAANDSRYRPGFLQRVLSFALPTGFVIGLLIFISYWSVGYDSSASVSTTAAAVVMVAGCWVLYKLARPLNWWKSILVLAMPTTFVTLIAVPESRRLLEFSVRLPYWEIALLGFIGIIIVELLWCTTATWSKPRTDKF